MATNFNLRHFFSRLILSLFLFFGAQAFAAQSGDFTYSSSGTAITITAYTGTGGSVMIPDTIAGLPVRTIGSSAFYNKTALTSITIPNSITSIGNSAFYSCTGLISVTIPNSVTSIGSNAFHFCTGLTSVTIPNSVTSIGDYSFYSCTGLTSVTIPNSVTSIGNVAFSRCSGLTSITVDSSNSSFTSLGGVLFNKNQSILIQFPGGRSGTYTIPNSVTTIGSYAFSYCSGLTSVTIPSNVTSIGDYSFYYCYGLTSATIPNSVTSIGGFAFCNCTGLTSVTIPNSVTSIGSSAFDSCNRLTSVTIPNSVTSIGSQAFSLCSGLTSITVDSSNSSFTSLGGVLFNKNQSILIQFPGGKSGTYTIPNNVTTIGSYAFSYCTGLTSVTIPNSVTSIGDYSFYYCSRLTSVTIPNSVTSIGDYSFYYCSGLTSVTIPNSVTSIGSSAFSRCTGLTSVTIPNSVTSISSFAFYSCTGLTSVSIPNSVTSIGSSAFQFCTGLTSVTIPNSVTSISSFAFYSCTGLTSVTIPSNVTSIGSSAFQSCTGLTSVTIPSSVTSIGNGAFQSCTGLTSVTIPSSVISIGSYAFYNCTGLTSATFLGNAPATFSTSAFTNTAPGFTIYYPANASGFTTPTWNGYPALPISPPGDFQYTTSGSTVTITGYTGSGGNVIIPTSIGGMAVTAIASDAFLNQTSLTSVVFPDGLTTIGSSAFNGCTGLSGMTLPGSVTSIGANAFYGTGISTISIPSSVTSIGLSAFGRCTNLTEITVSLSNPNYSSLDGVLFNKGRSALIQFPAGKAGAYDIPSGVTTISGSAFSYAAVLTGVTLPATVTTIGNYAFTGCVGLPRLILPDSVTTMGIYAFSGCTGLTEVTLSQHITALSSYAFHGCTGLTEIIIPASVTSINSYVFHGCSSLVRAVFEGNAPTTFGTSVFGNTATGFTIYYKPGGTGFTSPTWNGYPVQLLGVSTDFQHINDGTSITITGYTGSGGNVTVPSNLGGLPVRAIANNAFLDKTSITSLTLPSGLTSIGNNAFSGCTALASANIPDTVTTIGTNAFYRTGISTISIPASVTSIGTYAFGRCPALAIITVAPANPNYSSLDGVLFNKTQQTLIQYPSGKTGSYAIPSGTTTISASAFAYASALPGVTMPATLTTIGNYAFTTCTGLTSVVLPDSITSIGTYAFSGCSGLTSITLPANLTSILSYTFHGCTGLTAITLPSGVTSINTYAFYGCTALTSISIPPGVTSIGSSAFANCSALATATFEGNAPATFGTSVFANAASGFTVLYQLASTGFTTPTWKGYPAQPLGIPTDFQYTSDGTSITIIGYTGAGGDIVVPSQIGGLPVTEISTSAFYNNLTLSAVSLPDGITTIGGSAFADCDDLSSINIPQSVTSIGAQAFARCDNLELITVSPANPNYSSLEGVLFDKTQLTLIQYPSGRTGAYILPDSVTTIGEAAFAASLGLTGITLTDGLTTIGQEAFGGCLGLTGITLPESVTALDIAAFSNCTSLATATFLGNAPVSFASNAFSGAAPGFTIYYYSGSTGFTSPTWNGYPAVMLSRLISNFANWPVLSQLPSDRRGPLDRNGPLQLQNLLAYAMGLNPLTAVATDLPSHESLNTSNGIATFRFRRAKNAGGVTLSPLTSVTLAAWSSPDILSSEIIHNGGDWEIVEITVAAPSGGKLFFQLKAEAPGISGSVTATFNAAAAGNYGSSYTESGLNFQTTGPSGLAIANFGAFGNYSGSNALILNGAGMIDITSTGTSFRLSGFDISSPGDSGGFRLIVTDINGVNHVSDYFGAGSYDEESLTAAFGGASPFNNITNARLEDAFSQGIVLDNVHAVINQ